LPFAEKPFEHPVVMINLLRFSLLFLLLGNVSVSQAAKPAYSQEIWSSTAPGEKGDIGEETLVPPKDGSAKPIYRYQNVTVPTLDFYPAPKETNTGATVIVCPGGGYNILAWDLEGIEICDWLNSIGVNGVLLKYRVPRRKDREKHEAPLQDVQRTFGIVRSKAADWSIDPDRIGILGFSAGGHLSATASTNYQKRSYERVDCSDDLSCRPDFTVLVYPAYLVDNETKTKLEPEIKVDSNTPPAFMVHAGNDRIPAEGSIQYYLALRQVGVDAELHIHPLGGHGFGMRKSEYPVHKWTERCGEWMKSIGLLEKK
jgi:acetyl esterase/lipase